MHQVVFDCLKKQLTPPTPSWRSSGKIIQSSVGIIFTHDLSVLLVQRSNYPGDRNAYNIVFPGGQADANQTDLQACVREIQEQTGIDMTASQFEYLGRMPHNFYYVQKRGKALYICAHVWVMQPGCSVPVVLNQDELTDYRWVPFSLFCDINRYTKYVPNNMLTLPWGVRVEVCGVDVEMGRELWGITLWLFHYMLAITVHQLNKYNKQSPHLPQLLHLQTRMQDLDMRGGNACVRGGLQLCGKVWYGICRVNRFSYPPTSLTPYFLFLFALIACIILIW